MREHDLHKALLQRCNAEIFACGLREELANCRDAERSTNTSSAMPPLQKSAQVICRSDTPRREYLAERSKACPRCQEPIHSGAVELHQDSLR